MDLVQDVDAARTPIHAHDGHGPAHRKTGVALQMDKISGLGMSGGAWGMQFHEILTGRQRMMLHHPGLFGINGITRRRVFHESPASPCSKTILPSTATVKMDIRLVANQNPDEIYEKFCYDGDYTSIGKFYDKTLLLRGFSKSYAMTGWRLGFAAAPQSLKNVVEEMTKIQQYTFVCAPTPFQKAAIAALDYDVSKHVEAYKKKRDLLYEGLKGSFELVKPGGAFYAFVKAPAGKASKFVEKAIKNNVLIIPGNVFSEKDTHFRISYATSDDKIRQGVEILRKLS